MLAESPLPILAIHIDPKLPDPPCPGCRVTMNGRIADQNAVPVEGCQGCGMAGFQAGHPVVNDCRLGDVDSQEQHIFFTETCSKAEDSITISCSHSVDTDLSTIGESD